MLRFEVKYRRNLVLTVFLHHARHSLLPCLPPHTNSATNSLWDYFNKREEETLESLEGVSTSQEEGGDSSSDRRSRTNQQQELFWLNYEPDADDFDFL